MYKGAQTLLAQKMLPASSVYRITKTPSKTISQTLFLHSLSLAKPARSCRRRRVVVN